MIKNIEILKGCISCRNCENICPKIFQVNPTSKVISENFSGNETEILIAEATCPVNVIKVEKKGEINLSFKTSKVISKKFLTEDILEIILEKPENFSFKPGQYISMMFEDWKGKFSRQYSVAEVTEQSFSLTIKLGEKGRGASKLKKLKIGQKMKFLGPIGGFYLQNNSKEKYFISTGTGLAPFIAMGQNTAPKVKKHFIIGARYKKDFYYEEKLKNLENAEIHYFTSREKSKNSGRVTDFLPKIPKENSEIYICGNPEMVKEVLAYLKQNGFEEKNIFSEDFKVSGKYEPIWKEIFVNGNIPFLKEISWGIIFFAFFLSGLFLYKTATSSLFDNFLIFSTFQGFIFNLSWFSAVFVMFIRPLSDIFPKNNFLRKLKTLRKPLGILSAMLILVSFAGKWIFDVNEMFRYFSTSGRWNNFLALISRISEIFAFILLITSNNFSQKFLGKYWKKVQYLAYAYFITGALNAILNDSSAKFWDYFQYYGLVGIWIILWIFAFVKNKK